MLFTQISSINIRDMNVHDHWVELWVWLTHHIDPNILVFWSTVLDIKVSTCLVLNLFF